MSYLDSIQTGRQPAPPRVILYGTEGIGKSTWAACAPNPIFIQTEDGLSQLNCHKFPLAKSFTEVMASLAALRAEAHSYQTIVIDSLDWLERLVWAELCSRFNVPNIEKVDGGYGKGYTHALNPWNEIISRLNALRNERGMMFVGIAHAASVKVTDPEELATYNKYAPRLNEKASSLWCEWADAILFATRKILIQTADAGFNKTKAVAKTLGKDGSERIVRTVGGPACVAKNRYDLPAEMPLLWESFLAGVMAFYSQGT